MAVELRHLRYFAAVAEHGQVSRAARALYLTQPALSQALSQLERNLGFALFERMPHGMQLTPAGRELLGDAHAAIAAADRLLSRAADHRFVASGRLVVGYLTEGFPHLMGPLAEFGRARPGISVSVRELDFLSQHDALRTGGVDIALLYPPPPDMPLWPLGIARLSVAMRPDAELATATAVALEDLARQVLPRITGAPGYWRETYLLSHLRDGSYADTETELLSPHQVMAKVLTGECVSTVPDFLAERYAGEAFVTRPVEGLEPVPYGFTWTRETPAVRAFLEVLQDGEFDHPELAAHRRL
jgi:DNA-binding transcriptional LysR family regulator